MTDLRKAAEMALEALIVAHPMANTCNSLDKHSEAMSALRQALAQPEQEPVAWVEGLEKPQPRCVTNLKYLSVAEVDAGVQFIPLYTAPPSKPEQKPVIDRRLKVKIGRQYGYALNEHWFYLQPADEYAEQALTKHSGISVPPKREWVGLTDEERDSIARDAAKNDWHDYIVINATEAKLKEKNNG